MPQAAGNAADFTRSPKSLSKVSKIRSSFAANAITSKSLAPGATNRIQTTSCPAETSPLTAAPGKFSSARKRVSSRARQNPLGAQRIARIGETTDDVGVIEAGIIGENIGLAYASRIGTARRCTPAITRCVTATSYALGSERNPDGAMLIPFTECCRPADAGSKAALRTPVFAAHRRRDEGGSSKAAPRTSGGT